MDQLSITNDVQVLHSTRHVLQLTAPQNRENLGGVRRAIVVVRPIPSWISTRSDIRPDVS